MFEFKRLKTVQLLLWGAILLVVHTSAGVASLAYIPIDRNGDWDISLNGQGLRCAVHTLRFEEEESRKKILLQARRDMPNLHLAKLQLLKGKT